MLAIWNAIRSKISSIFGPWLYVIILLSIMGGGAYTYYSSTQTKLSALTAENAKLKSDNAQLIDTNKQNLQTISDLQKSFDQIRANYLQAQQDFQNIKNENRLIQNSIINSKINVSNFTNKDTGTVQTKINIDNNYSNRCIELLSGASLTQAEKNAKTANEFNPQCPWLFGNIKSN